MENNTIALEPIRINDEHVFQPPPAPADRSQILLHQFSKSDQYWRHDEEEMRNILGLPEIFFHWNRATIVNQQNTIYDNFGNLVALSIDETRDLQMLRDREMKRRQNGVHIFINGKITYLTGDNYNFLVYYIIPDAGHPHYRRFQRDIFYFINICRADPHCLGGCIPKAKKTGLSHIMTSVLLNRSMMIRNRAFGVLNKSQVEANDLNINFFWLGYLEYPPIMKPNVSHKNLSKVQFGQPLVKYTGTATSVLKAAEQQRNKPLNTWVYSAPTSTQLKFDGPLMEEIHIDEFLKIKKIGEIFAKASETVKKQQTIIGKIWMTSYPPEVDDDSFFEGKEIFYNSKLSTIDRESVLPRTISGLYCHFVGALVSTDGTFDKYGEADEMKALALNQAERDKCKNAEEEQARIRQYCRTEDECFRSGGQGSTFPNTRLAIVKDLIESMERSKVTPIFVNGDLQWTNGIYSPVEWIPRTDQEMKNRDLGWWRKYEHYADREHNRVYKDSVGRWTPYADSKFFASTDPTEYKTASQVIAAPSNSAIMVQSFPDAARNTFTQRIASNVPVLEYLGRREDPEQYIDDLVKTIFYCGCYVIIEANKAWVFTRMKQLGLQNFLIVRMADGTIIPYRDDILTYPVVTSKETIEEYCRLGNIYLSKPLAGSDRPDYLMALRSHRLVSGLMDFNPNNTTKFDLPVCWLLGRLGMHAFSAFYDQLKKREKAYDQLSKAYAAIVR